MSELLTGADIPFRGAANSRTSSPAAPPMLLRDTLHGIEAFIRRYVVLTNDQALIVTLWVAHTHAIEAADCTPYLQITSATKRAGKTRLLEVLEPLVARPWLTGRTSAAVLVRKTDAEQPTLLLDESDAAFGGEKDYAEALRGILNSGYRRSGKASLCVGQGANLSYRDFHTFGAKAIAGIGELPCTVADRAIPIQLRRRKSDEPCARWRERDGHAEAAPCHEQLVGWAAGDVVLEQLRQARPALPSLADDRKADVLEPLLAIADVAGGWWPKRARKAAVALAGSAEDSDIVVELLRDLSSIVTAWSRPLIPTQDVLEKLTGLDDRPWASWKHDKPMTARALARLLKPLGIHPAQTENKRGYRTDAFEDAFSRYLPSEASFRQEPNETGPESRISKPQAPIAADALKSADQAHLRWAADGMTRCTSDPGDGGDEPF